METLTDRIKKLLLQYEMSPAMFADAIKVPRPSISHILSGRNKPSLEMVQKIILRFGNVDLYWLLDLNKPDVTNSVTAQHNKSKAETPNTENSKELTNVITENRSSILPSAPKSEKMENIRRTEKIIILYSDKSFSIYTPE